MSTPRRLIPVLLVLLTACGGGKRSEGDAEDDGDVVDEDAGGEVLPDVTPDGEEDPDEDGEEDPPEDGDDPAPDPVTDPEDDDVASTDTVDDDAVSTDVSTDDGGATDTTVDMGVLCTDRVTDGRFQTTTAWTTTGSCAINVTGPGHMDTGEGEIPPVSTCDLDSISQTFTLPSETDCRAARLEVWLNVMSFVGGMGTAFAVDVNGNYHHFPGGMITTWTEVSNCLGEAAHTGSMTMTMSAAYPPMECDSSPSFAQGLRVDNARIEYDTGCPLIGTAVNGDLEEGTGFGWETSSLLGGIAEADAPAAGVGGSYAAHLHIERGCELAAMSVPLSIPTTTTMTSPALSYQGKLTPGETVELAIGDIPAIILEGGTGSFVEQRVCLPRHMSGAVYPVEWSAQYWGACGLAAGPLDFYVDNVRLVDDSTCLNASGMLDPGFETSITDATRYGWILEENAGSWGGAVVAEVHSDATNARTGTGVAYLSVDQRCDSATLKQAIEIPAPTTSEGPAVKLWYRYPSPSVSILQATVFPFQEYSGRRIADTTLSGTSTFTQGILCLPPALAGRPAVIVISLHSYGTCADFFTAAESVWLDDFEVTTDSTCPTT